MYPRPRRRSTKPEPRRPEAPITHTVFDGGSIIAGAMAERGNLVSVETREREGGLPVSEEQEGRHING